MLPNRLNANRQSSSSVIFTGGINESISNLELSPGELIRGENYIELEGVYHGYASLGGYEPFDGTALASSVDVVRDSEGVVTDDSAREARRAAITAAPGTGPARGVHFFNGEVYAVRDYDATYAVLSETSLTGWNPIYTGAAGGPEYLAGGSPRFVDGTFAAYPIASSGYPPGVPNVKCFFMADGVSIPISYDGTTVREISDANLPCDTGAATRVFPHTLASFDQRMWLAFPGGHLYYSAIGDPSDWDAADGAGYYPVGDEITDLVVTPGNTLVVFMENSIKILYLNEDSAATYPYIMKEFSQRSGAVPKTAHRMLGKTYYIDDRGLTSLSATQAFGDFTAKSLSRKVQRTLLSKIGEIAVAVPKRDSDQYTLLFEDGSGIVFTFNPNRSIKGATFIDYKIPVTCATEGHDAFSDLEFYFGSENGFIYKADSGTSFNGEEIPAYFVTSYHHHGSPTAVKRFLKLLFEITSTAEVEFNITTSLDYGSRDSPRNSSATLEDLEAQGGVWGTAVWGSFTWGGSSVVQNPSLYIQAIGVNISVTIRTSEKYADRHILHNVILKLEKLREEM